MHVLWITLSLCLVSSGSFSQGFASNFSSGPPQVSIGAILAFNSTIGKVAKIAIQEAVKDVNFDSSLLNGTQLFVDFQDSNCHTFLATVEALQFVKNDTVAIIGPQSSMLAHAISYVANNFHVPLLSFAATDPTLSSSQYPYFVRTVHSDRHQMTAIADIVKYYGWREVISIYIDDDYGRNGVEALGDALTARGCKVFYRAGIPVTNGTNWNVINHILVKVVQMECKVIVLHACSDVSHVVFSVAQSLGLMHDGYVWIATDCLSSVMDSFPSLSPDKMQSMQGILFLRQHTEDSDRKRAFTSRWNNLTGGSIRLNSYALYAYDTVWLVARALNSFFEQGGNISFSNASKLYAAEEMKVFDGGELLLNNILHNDFIGLTGSMKFDSDRSLTHPAYDILNVFGTGFRRIGYWSNYSGLSTLSPELLYSRPSNLSRPNQTLYTAVWPGETTITPRGWMLPNNGKQLRIGVPKRVSYTEFVSQVPGTDNFEGFCIDVFTAALSLLPYDVPYKFIPYGNGISNPSYSNLVDMIAAGELDGAVGDISITTNRTMLVDFTEPYTSSGLVVVAPFKKLTSGPWAFLSPFTTKVWVMIFVFVLIFGLCIWVLEHRVNDEFRGPPHRQALTILWVWVTSIYIPQRGKNIMGTLGRVVMLTWLFLVLGIKSSYTASLTSFLTVQELYSATKGIDSLINSSELIGYQVGSFAEAYLLKLGIAQSRLVALGTPKEYASALLRGSKNGGVAAVVDERPYFDLFISDNCEFEVVGGEFTKGGWGFAFPRGSPLPADLTTAILTLSINGELQQIYDKWLTVGDCKTERTGLNTSVLHLRGYAGLFKVWGIITGIAVLVYFLGIFRVWCLKGEATQPGTEQEPRISGFKRLRNLISRASSRDTDTTDRSSRDTDTTGTDTDTDRERERKRDRKRRRLGKSLSHLCLLNEGSQST